MPHPQRWSHDAIKDIAATPWSAHEDEKPEVLRVEGGADPESTRKDRVPVVRGAYIRETDFYRYRYTKVCPRCQHIVTYDPHAEVSTPHADDYRQRIMAE